MASGLEGVKALSDLTGVQGQIDSLKENTTGGIWSKFKAHASRAMTRPGATQQAVGASALILGGLAKAGLLVGISTFLGASISFPPAAAGIALAGGALFLALGLRKGYKHAKEVANQKAQDNNQLSASTKDIALEFVKQTAENIIFGVPTLLLKFIPGVQKKLEACAEKYEAKQDVKEGAAKISEQIGELQGIQTTITNNINTIKGNVNQKISDAKTQIQKTINEETNKVLQNEIDKLNKQIEPYKTQLDQLQNLENLNQIGKALGNSDFQEKALAQLRDIAKEGLKQAINNSNIETQKETLEKIFAKIDNANIEDLQKIQTALNNINVDLGMKVVLQKLETGLNLTINNKINSLKRELPEELLQKLENTQAALEALTKEGTNTLNDAAQTILQDAKNQARDTCKQQIEKIKKELTTQAQDIINKQKQEITKVIEPKLQDIERAIHGAFATLEKTIDSTDIGVGKLEELKTHVEQKIKEFEELKFMDTLRDQLVDPFDFEKDISLDEVFDEITAKANTLTASLAKDAAEKFVQVGLQRARQVGAQKMGSTMGNLDAQFKNMGLGFE